MIRKLLIVDDETILAAAYEIFLRQAGYEVYVANDARTGLDMAYQLKPDIVLLDMLMPKMNGIDFLVELRSKPGFSKTKVVILSNIDNPNLKKAAKKLGVDSYLIKADNSPSQIVSYVSNNCK